MLSSIIKGAQGNSLGLQNLTVEMEKSIASLEKIQLLLKGKTIPKTIKQEQWQEIEQQCQQKTLEIEKKEKELIKKDDLIFQTQQQVTELKQALDLLAQKYKQETDYWQQKQSDSQDKFQELEKDYKGLIQKNDELENMIDQLKQAYELEIREKERENRDKELESKEKEEEFQRNLKCVQQEKVNECSTLKNKIEELELENQGYKKRIDGLNAIYNNNNQSLEELTDDQLNKIRLRSRIPVLTSRFIQKQLDIKREMDLMKDDLLLYQDKLVEKISQNKQLESAIERMNEHCQILRNSLNETREESADRYRKMMKYMQENRLLKDQLDCL